MAIVEAQTSGGATGGRMLTVCFNKDANEPFTVLCLGAHSDYIEIGCGGTLLRLKEKYRHLRLYWVVFSAAGVRGEEALASAELFAAGCDKTVVLKSFRDGCLPYVGGEVKDVFEQLKRTVTPDLILTHWGGDAHQDHRLLNELTWNTFRNHVIWEYEIPKYDGDLGRPGVFVPLDEAVCTRKTEYLMRVFASQRDKRWFQRDTFLGLMRLRGMECNAASGYAEAFASRKFVF